MDSLPKRPRTIEELAGIVGGTARAGGQLRVAGSGSLPLSRFDPARPVHDVSTLRMNKVLEHAVGDMTVTVGAGITLEALQRELAWKNQWLPVDPPTVCLDGRTPGGRTIGGLIATNSLGPLREMDGGTNDWRRLLLGTTWIDGGGRIVKGGGRTMKNAAGYQTQRMMIGACGTLGAIAEVTLRTSPRPEEEGALVLYAADAERAAALLAAVRLAAVTPAYLQVVGAGTFAANPLGLPAAEGVTLIVGFLDRGPGWRAQVEAVRMLPEAQGMESIALGAAQAGRLRLWMTSEPAAAVGSVGFRAWVGSAETCRIMVALGNEGASWVVAEAGAGVARGVAPAAALRRAIQGEVLITQGASAEPAASSSIFAAVKEALDPRAVLGRMVV